MSYPVLGRAGALAGVAVAHALRSDRQELDGVEGSAGVRGGQLLEAEPHPARQLEGPQRLGGRVGPRPALHEPRVDLDGRTGQSTVQTTSNIQQCNFSVF